MAKYELTDDGVVVIVGSGAGGGTLANELCQKGVKVVLLEAGPRIEIKDFVNDEWPMFNRIAWLDKRTTSGSWRVAKNFPNLPAWTVKAVGRNDGTLGRRFPALQGRGVQGADGLRQHRRRELARLAHHAGGSGTVLRARRGQDGRHRDP